MDSLETDDQLTIVNRSLEYQISKKLIRKIPYFENLLSLDLKEAKENKVDLDFDSKAFKSIFNWIEIGCILMEMDCVINLSNIADYFGITDGLIDDCFTFFHDNFSIEHLPVIIPQVTSTSNLINSGALNAFICRYFLKIVNTPTWLDYPVETVGYICVLDLMVHSEFQVFDAIMRWVNFTADFRKCYLKELLKFVRLCHLEDKDLSKIKENEAVSSSDFEPELCSRNNCNCGIDRTKQGYFIVIDGLRDKNLRVKVLDGDFFPFINQVMQSDESLPLNIFHGKHFSDIPFHSGRKMVRIDWKQNKYRLFDFSTYKSYYHKIHRCIFDEQEGSNVATRQSCASSYDVYEGSLLETAEKFILVRNEEFDFRCLNNPSIQDVNYYFELNYKLTYMATILDNNIYMLTHSFEFFQFNIDGNLEFKKIALPRLRNKFKFSNLLLTSKQADDDRVIFIDRTTKDIVCFNVNTQRLKSIGRIIDCKSKSTDGQKESNALLTFTFGFVSTDSINLCLERKLTQ
uniref:BACK domain-containing protein n=1 Tax=Tetranychus urticae TaxID=32264 RepID=T1JY98_TETUR